jgi:hypothetical protein
LQPLRDRLDLTMREDRLARSVSSFAPEGSKVLMA